MWFLYLLYAFFCLFLSTRLQCYGHYFIKKVYGFYCANVAFLTHVYIKSCKTICGKIIHTHIWPNLAIMIYPYMLFGLSQNYILCSKQLNTSSLMLTVICGHLWEVWSYGNKCVKFSYLTKYGNQNNN